MSQKEVPGTPADKANKKAVRYVKVKEVLDKHRNSEGKIQDGQGNEHNTVVDMCRHYNIGTNAFYSRLQHGWSFDRALLTPYKQRTKVKVEGIDNKEFDTYKLMCKQWGIKTNTFIKRMSRDNNIKKH